MLASLDRCERSRGETIAKMLYLLKGAHSFSLLKLAIVSILPIIRDMKTPRILAIITIAWVSSLWYMSGVFWLFSLTPDWWERCSKYGYNASYGYWYSLDTSMYQCVGGSGWWSGGWIVTLPTSWPGWPAPTQTTNIVTQSGTTIAPVIKKLTFAEKLRLLREKLRKMRAQPWYKQQVLLK